MPLASATQVALSRLTRILALVAVAFCLGAPTAGAVPVKKQDANFTALWKTILQTPGAQNPIGKDGCFLLGGILAPFGGVNPKGAGPCTVKPGTKIFVVASSVECSTFEPPPYFGANEKELRECVGQDVTRMPIVTLDGKPLPLAEVETPLLNITLPAEDNIFNVPPGPGLQGQSVAHGWVALLHPLTPGEHKIVGEGAVVVPGGDGTFTTIIKVQPGFKP